MTPSLFRLTIHFILTSFFAKAIVASGVAQRFDLFILTCLRTLFRQHITLTTDKHPCPLWDSNPQSQQASGRRPTP